jgi:hypothetical protein
MDEIRIPASVNANSGNGGKIGMARRTRLVDGMSVKPRTASDQQVRTYPVTTEADMAPRNSEVRKFDRKR